MTHSTPVAALRPVPVAVHDVRSSGRVPEIGTAWRAQARKDLAFWRT